MECISVYYDTLTVFDVRPRVTTDVYDFSSMFRRIPSTPEVFHQFTAAPWEPGPPVTDPECRERLNILATVFGRHLFMTGFAREREI